MKQYGLMVSFLVMGLAASVSGCQKQELAEAVSAEVLTEPPEIALTDVLSGEINAFSVFSGNYEWNWKTEKLFESKDLESVVACGVHPLDMEEEMAESLLVPDYNQMDGAMYMVSCPVQPDRILLTGWEVEKLGDPESPAKESISYEEPFLLSLKPNMVYELQAVWEEDKLMERGFYGEAGYAFLTEEVLNSETGDQKQELVIAKEPLETDLEQLAWYTSCPFVYGEKEWELQTLVQEEMVLNGELAMDDQGRFLIRAISGEDSYVLFDEMVQLGMPEADAWVDEEEQLHIVLRDVRTARYRVTDFVYDPEKEEFLGFHVIDGEGINYLGTTGK